MRTVRRKGNWLSRVSFTRSTFLFTFDSSFDIISEVGIRKTKAEAEERSWNDIKKKFEKKQKKSRPNTRPT